MGAVTVSYEASADRLFEAVVRTISALPYRIIDSDPHTRTVSFNTGMSWRSWAGQNVTVVVSEGDGPGSTLTISGKRLQIDWQMIDWGELGSIRRRFLRQLAETLPSVPEPAGPAAAGRASEARTADG